MKNKAGLNLRLFFMLFLISCLFMSIAYSWSLTITSPASGARINQSTYPITITIVPNDDVINITNVTAYWNEKLLGFNDSSNLTAYTIQGDFSNKNGTATLNVTSTQNFTGSAAYNETYSLNVVVDTIAPVITIVSPSQNWTNYSTSSVTLSATVKDYNLSYCEFWTNQTGSWAIKDRYPDSSVLHTNTYSSPLTITNTTTYATGDYKWAVFCNDTFENTVWTANHTFTVDLTDPVVNSISFDDQYIGNAQEIFITVNATDANTKVSNVTLSGSGLTLNSSSLSNLAGSDIWNDTITINASSSGTYTLTVTATDQGGYTNSSTHSFYLDRTSPSISVTLPEDSATYTDANGDITFNWTVTEKNLTYTNVSVDGWTWKASTTQNGTNVSVISGITAGTHTAVFIAEDEAGNYATNVSRTFIVNAMLNTTQKLSNLNTSAGSAVFDMNLTDSDGYDISNNKTYLDKIYDLDINMTTTKGGTAFIKVSNFNGTSANWNKTFTASNADSTSTISLLQKYGTTTYDQIIFSSMTDFLASSAYYANVSFDYNITNRSLQAYFIENDGATTISQISSCGTISNSMTSACYEISGSHTYIYLPHFSGVIIANDTSAPFINMTTPANASTTNTTLTVAGVVKDLNTPVCNYSVDSFTVNKSLTLSGSSPDYTFSLGSKAYANGTTHNLSIVCDDSLGNRRYTNFSWTTVDVTAPIVQSSSPSGTYDSDTSSVTLSVSLDEIASKCAYSTSNTTLASMTSYLSSSNNVTWTGDVDTSAGTHYRYYVRCNDTAGNIMDPALISFTVSNASSSSSSSGGGGGTSSSSTSTTKASKAKVWYSIEANSEVQMDVESDDIAVTLITLTLNEKRSNVELSVKSLTGKPSSTSDISTEVYEYLQIVLEGAADNTVSDSKIRFEVPVSWLTGKGINAQDIVLLRYDDGAWSELDTRVVSTGTNVLFEATTPGYSYFAIAIKEGVVSSQETIEYEDTTQPEQITEEETEPEEETEEEVIESSGKSWIIWLVLGIVIIAGLGGLFYWSYTQEQKGNKKKK